MCLESCNRSVSCEGSMCDKLSVSLSEILAGSNVKSHLISISNLNT